MMQTKPLYLPEAKNDFAFAVLGGEGLAVLFLAALLGLWGIRRYRKRRKPSAGRRKSK